MPTRVLMSEGSSLSARESLTGLGRAGFHVEVLDPSPACVSRFSKWCRRVHVSPRFGAEPEAYLGFVLDLLERDHFDVLYPAHEQALVFARFREQLQRRTCLALPPFEVFERLQSKVGFVQVLDELSLPQPASRVVTDDASLRAAVTRFPCWVKAAFGTASQATFHVRSNDDVNEVCARLREVLHEGVVVQEQIDGWLGRVQSVFAHGRLVAVHACRQLQEGVGGGDVIKRSIAVPRVIAMVEALGRHLAWHGGLSVDFLMKAEDQPYFIDANPRLAEPGNALAAGVNLPEALVRVSLGDEPAALACGRPDVQSHLGLQALLRSAAGGATRGELLRVLADLTLHRGAFTSSVEELTPFDSLEALVPMLAVAGELLVDPARWAKRSTATVQAYAATAAVVRAVRRPAS